MVKQILSFAKIRFTYFAIVVGLLVLVFNHKVYSGDKSKPIIRSYEFSYSLTTIYDDNILKYSEKYLERYKNGEDQGRFRINSIGDVTLLNRFKVVGNMYLFGKHKSEPSIGVRYKSYSSNGVKNFWGFEVGWRQYLSKKTSFKIRFIHIPNYYVRNYRDKDVTRVIGYTPASFRPFEFSKSNVSLWFRNYYYKYTQTTFYVSYFWYKHSQDFIEYDSNNYLLGLRVKQTLNKYLKLQSGYNYVISNAKGFDRPNEVKKYSDNVDASFREHIFYLGLDWTLPPFIFEQSSIKFTGYYHKRLYNTVKPSDFDPMHAGRVDNVLNFSGRYNVKILNYLEVDAFVTWNARFSSTKFAENEIILQNEKNYSQYIAGVRVKFKFLLIN